MLVEVVPYNPQWKKAFEAESQQIAKVLAGRKPGRGWGQVACHTCGLEPFSFVECDRQVVAITNIEY